MERTPPTTRRQRPTRWLVRLAALALALGGMAQSPGDCLPDPEEPEGCRSDADCTADGQGTCDLETGECVYPPEPVYGPVEDEAALRERLAASVGEAIWNYDVQHIDVPALLARLDAGEGVALPIVSLEGRLAEIVVDGVATDPLSPTLELVWEKGPQGAALPVPPVVQYRLGCEAPQRYCGVLTVLDEDRTRMEVMIFDDANGFLFLESVESFLTYVDGVRPDAIEPSSFLIYNTAFHAPLDISCDLVAEVPPDVVPLELPVITTLDIVLDADARFYDLNRDTVWNRQRAVLGGINIIYAVLERLAGFAFDIEFQVKGQEAWLPGHGPTTTDGSALEVEINDPDYFMITHPQPGELSLYFAGDDMDGSLIGKAGSICGSDCCGANFDAAEPENHAWAQQVDDDNGSFTLASFYARVIVSAHELGHLVGMLHTSGNASACGSPEFPSWCGPSIGLAGSGGDPGERVPFFSDANADNIAACVEAAVGSP